MIMERKDIVEFFRDDEKISLLNSEDRYEIMTACCVHSDRLYWAIQKVIDRYESGLLEEV